MRQRRPHSGAFLDEATRLRILIVALQVGRDQVADLTAAVAAFGDAVLAVTGAG